MRDWRGVMVPVSPHGNPFWNEFPTIFIINNNDIMTCGVHYMACRRCEYCSVQVSHTPPLLLVYLAVCRLNIIQYMLSLVQCTIHALFISLSSFFVSFIQAGIINGLSLVDRPLVDRHNRHAVVAPEHNGGGWLTMAAIRLGAIVVGGIGGLVSGR